MRTFAMGDPQAPFDRVMAILAANRVLEGDRLAADVRLLSIGDHFDYDPQAAEAGRDGLRVLRWLAGHDPAQVTLLFGNHDAARVMELAGVDDARFAAARVEALTLDSPTPDAQRWAFRKRFPDIATPGLAARDYAAFSVEQRTLVVELLLAGRFHLAVTGTLLDRQSVLLTHAGITTRELDLLGGPRDPQQIAAALEARLAAAIEVVRADWEAGTITPLSLAPLHVQGQGGSEGGGLLYHRPSNPDRPGADRSWELDRIRPRRFDPRTLPRGLVQVAGHTGHNKCLEELGETWTTEAARAREHYAGIRTLRSDGEHVVYTIEDLPPAPAAATLLLIDGGMRRAAVPADFKLLELHALDC